MRCNTADLPEKDAWLSNLGQTKCSKLSKERDLWSFLHFVVRFVERDVGQVLLSLFLLLSLSLFCSELESMLEKDVLKWILSVLYHLSVSCRLWSAAMELPVAAAAAAQQNGGRKRKLQCCSRKGQHFFKQISKCDWVLQSPLLILVTKPGCSFCVPSLT